MISHVLTRHGSLALGYELLADHGNFRFQKAKHDSNTVNFKFNKLSTNVRP